MSPKDAKECRIDECSSKGLTFHRLPNSKSSLLYFKKWIGIIGTGLQSINPFNVYQKKPICSDHFSSNDINPGIKLTVDDSSPQPEFRVELVRRKYTVPSSSALINNYYSSCENVIVVFDKYFNFNTSGNQILNDSYIQNNDSITDSKCTNYQVCGLIRPLSPTVSHQCIWFSKLYL